MKWSGPQSAEGFELQNYRDETMAAKPAYSSPDDAGRTIFVTTPGADYGVWIGSEAVTDWIRPATFGGGAGGGMVHLKRFDLGAPAIQFDVPIGVTIKPDGTEAYRGIYINALLEAVSSNVQNPKMVVTADLVEANYYSSVGVAEPRLKNGFILTANPNLVRGFFMPWIDDGDMAYTYHLDTCDASRHITSPGFEAAVVWLPGSFTSFDTLRFYRDAGGDYGTNTFVDVWGVL
jgi:hypothetical protein